MRLSSLIMVGCLLVFLGFMPYLFHQAAQPSLYRLNTSQPTLSWSSGPDVELNAASLRKLNAEVRQLISPGSGQMDCPFQVVSLGKRRVEIQIVGKSAPSEGLKSRVASYVQRRLPDLAREQ